MSTINWNTIEDEYNVHREDFKIKVDNTSDSAKVSYTPIGLFVSTNILPNVHKNIDYCIKELCDMISEVPNI